jgi:chromosome segregation protein
MLKSLELNGFKSFAKKSELEFGSSVTAIVGPNGSGKSNVVEAFRFVLGEQSIKSMRGKSGGDLIFKGSKTIAKLNRAKVSIVFDNKNKVFALSSNEDEQGLNLEFETIEISREVFADGNNVYSINGTPVRLKDIHDLLASVHIGSSGHHIISQGQADRILSSSGKERRAMIEDALGLKIYQIKIKDAEKKIEKTEQNVKEVESLRREIAPHLRYLKKQVEKIKQAEDLRTKLGAMYREYLAKQDHSLNEEYTRLIQNQSVLSEALLSIDNQLAVFGHEQHFSPEEGTEDSIKKHEQEIEQLVTTKEELSRNIGRLEVMIEMAGQQKAPKQGKEIVTFDRNEIDAFLRDMSVFIDQSLKSGELQEVRGILGRIKDAVAGLSRRLGTVEKVEDSREDTASLQKLEQELGKLKQGVQDILNTIQEKHAAINTIKSSLEVQRNSFYESQRARFEVEKNRAGLVSEQHLIQERIGRAREARQFLEEEIREGVVLVGKEILSYGEFVLADHNFDKSSIEEIRREIERTKIKLEEAGASGGEEALQEYDEVVSRDQFLEKELLDLSSALDSLKNLIVDLRGTLDSEFQLGIKKINTEFQEFFSVMFGGGNAGLSVVKKQIKKKSLEEGEESLEEDASLQEEGVEIEVSLPHKKVRELTMLSGGERSLTSIALLFAMSQVNPPPFLVLDETDAALDEANSRRYGDMIERLSKYSQLIVVTHNRETMSRAKTLYGVTVGSDGASKLLSIKFDDAEIYAK